MIVNFGNGPVKRNLTKKSDFGGSSFGCSEMELRNAHPPAPRRRGEEMTEMAVFSAEIAEETTISDRGFLGYFR